MPVVFVHHFYQNSLKVINEGTLNSISVLSNYVKRVPGVD